MEVLLLRVVLADLGPEVAQQLVGEALEAHVVQARGALHEVAGEQFADIVRPHVIERDDLRNALASVRLDVLPVGGRVRLERPDCAQQLPGDRRAACGALVGCGCGRLVQVRGGDLGFGQAGMGEDAGDQP